MPRGVKNGIAQFQWTEDFLRGLDCAYPFVDDVIVSSETPEMTDEELIEAHFVDLCNVPNLLRRHKLTCNGAKAVLFATEVEFARQVVSHGIRRPNLGKLASLAHWERPKNITEMRAFLEFCNYYSTYVHMYAERAAPLTKLLQVGREDSKKGSKKTLGWTPESEKAFDGMKAALLKPPSLHLLDPDNEVGAQDRRLGLCRRGGPGASRGAWQPCSCGVLETSPGHPLCLAQVGRPHWAPASDSVHGPPVPAVLA